MKLQHAQVFITSSITLRSRSHLFNFLLGSGGAQGVLQHQDGESQQQLLALHIVHQVGESVGVIC